MTSPATSDAANVASWTAIVTWHSPVTEAALIDLAVTLMTTLRQENTGGVD